MPILEDDPERPWDAPGTYVVAPGIHRVPLVMPGDGLRAVNAYVLTDDAGPVLIDPGAGSDTSMEALDAALGDLGIGPRDVTDILVTHYHFDHYAQAIRLRQRYGTPVAMGAEEEPSLHELRTWVHPYERHMLVLRANGAGDLADEVAVGIRATEDIQALIREAPDRWIAAAEPLPSPIGPLEVVPTPGHTRGHVVFRDPGGTVMFAGDHVLPGITPSIGLEATSCPLPLADYLDSLRRVRELPDARLLPAHGHVGPSVHARVDELVDHHADRLAAVEAAVTAGDVTGLAVAMRLRWTRRGRRFDELDLFNRMLACLEAVFHLDVLAARGRLSVTEDDGVRRFTIA